MPQEARSRRDSAALAASHFLDFPKYTTEDVHVVCWREILQPCPGYVAEAGSLERRDLIFPSDTIQ
jgi:hypothetical protein